MWQVRRGGDAWAPRRVGQVLWGVQREAGHVLQNVEMESFPEPFKDANPQVQESPRSYLSLIKSEPAAGCVMGVVCSVYLLHHSRLLQRHLHDT